MTYTEKSDKVVVPDRYSPEWNDYVMGHFLPDELTDGNPNVYALRRVVGLLIGVVTKSQSKIVESPKNENGQRATVEHTIEIEMGAGSSMGFNPTANHNKKTHVYTDVACCSIFSTKPPYNAYPTSMAGTRGEARVLRKLLGIKGPAAEELTSTEAPQEQIDFNPDEKVSSNVISVIKLLCHRQNINLDKFINAGGGHYNSIEDVPTSVAKKMVEVLNGYYNNPVPEHLLGE